MRRPLLVLSAFALLTGVASCRKAAVGSLPVEISTPVVGYQPGPLDRPGGSASRDTLFKAGHWTPVQVTLKGSGIVENADMVVKTIDSDDVHNEYVVSLGQLDFNLEPSITRTAYVRPGKIESPVEVSIRSKGQSVSAESSILALDPSSFLYATIGARLSGVRVPGQESKESSRSELASLEKIDELPNRWIGYNTIDLAILNTGSLEFTRDLLNDPNRMTALTEWVARGGKLILCVNSNQGLFQNRADLAAFLPVEFKGSASVDMALVNWGLVNTDITDVNPKTPLNLCRMTAKTDRVTQTLIEARTGSGVMPLAIQAPFGRGRVVVLALDPDQLPFNRWKQQGVFWQKILNEVGPKYIEAKGEAGFATDTASDDMATQMQRTLESFDGVPVVSFWWVALFIFVYILIVGPLDYLFLKKVVKRLELTWVTFPIVVLLVSVAAYLTAYALKGGDQRLNKIDLIEFDLTNPNEPTALGQTWFTVFSPRVQNYTLGVSPSEEWGIKSADTSPPLLSWMGHANNKRQSLFRRSYEYDSATGGLRNVPIQVWSTKGFQADWMAKIDPKSPPMTANLKAVGTDLTGKLTSHLPVPLENAVIFYRGNYYELGTINPGAADAKVIGGNRRALYDWINKNPGMSKPLPPPGFGGPWAPPPPAPIKETIGAMIRTAMFHEAFGDKTPRNAGYRELDQSWRINTEAPPKIAVVYGQISTVNGSTDDVNRGKSTITQLWIGDLPGDGKQVPKPTGRLRQESYLRFYVPVRIAE